MNKTAIKNFAIWARQKLISEITYKAGLLGINEAEISAPMENSTSTIQFFDVGTKEPSKITGIDISKRSALVTKIREKEKDSDYKTAFNQVVEEVAYTWFNRLIAIRFMEVNEYLPSKVRVLSSETVGKNEPDIVTNPYDTDMEFTNAEMDLITKLKDENKLDDLFRMLFIKQCNKLNDVLPNLFEKTNHYTELLLSISFTDADGVLRHLVNDIGEDDFKEAVEIIGWLYQYYNTEPKADVFAGLKKNVKITKEKIPAATQLFTPDWIVRYMVENSLGRIYIDSRKNEGVYGDGRGLDEMTQSEIEEKRIANEKDLASQMGWKYYLPEAEQTKAVSEKLVLEQYEMYSHFNISDIKIIDPCMGSGHILVYAFDVLVQIYESHGYTARDAVASILENNLFGLDIDERAYQLSYFALMMKARSYDRRFFSRGVEPQVYCPMGYADGQEYGSLLQVDELEEMPQAKEEITLFDEDYEIQLNTWNFRRLLCQKYDVVVTNPPYMGSKGMSAKLSKYVQDNYADSKSDMFAVFIERTLEMAKKNGYSAMITQHAFMFLSSYEKLRAKLLCKDIVNMAHLGARAFEEIGGEVVQTTSWVMKKSDTKGYKGTYKRLVDFNSQDSKEEAFLANGNLHVATQENFSKIPGSPIAYWVSKNFVKMFENRLFFDYSISDGQNVTSDNGKFVRNHWEVKNKDIGKGEKWRLYAKGGGYRKWYGNLIDIVDWSENAISYYHKESSARVIPEYLWYKQGITWGLISSNLPSFRLLPEAATFDKGGSSVFVKNYENYNSFLGILNSKVFLSVVKVLNATLNFQVKDIRSMPIILKEEDAINEIVQQNISLSKTDWDSFETSWDFRKHPFIANKNFANEHHQGEDFSPATKLEDAYIMWQAQTIRQFGQLKANEEELNRIFIDIYGLQDELTPEVEDKDVTVRLADKTRDVKSFISYAVGCMFGRYSLDVEGLAYAGGAFDNSKYTTFAPDADNCIPITDENYFEDDIVGRFAEFVKVVYGADTLEQNLDFIADALPNKGDDSRDVIRNYFLKDFYKDHVKIYQKRPIYWLYDSGKQNGFKALIYMHRYNQDTTGLVRVDYLHNLQKIYEREIIVMKENVEIGHEVAKSQKRLEKLTKQLKEAKEYDEKIAHLALSRIAIDLDDGVKVNYEKVQTGQDGNKLEILGKV